MIIPKDHRIVEVSVKFLAAIPSNLIKHDIRNEEYLENPLPAEILVEVIEHCKQVTVDDAIFGVIVK